MGILSTIVAGGIGYALGSNQRPKKTTIRVKTNISNQVESIIDRNNRVIADYQTQTILNAINDGNRQVISDINKNTNKSTDMILGELARGFSDINDNMSSNFEALNKKIDANTARYNDYLEFNKSMAAREILMTPIDVRFGFDASKPDFKINPHYNFLDIESSKSQAIELAAVTKFIESSGNRPTIYEDIIDTNLGVFDSEIKLKILNECNYDKELVNRILDGDTKNPKILSSIVANTDIDAEMASKILSKGEVEPVMVMFDKSKGANDFANIDLNSEVYSNDIKSLSLLYRNDMDQININDIKDVEVQFDALIAGVSKYDDLNEVSERNVKDYAKTLNPSLKSAYLNATGFKNESVIAVCINNERRFDPLSVGDAISKPNKLFDNGTLVDAMIENRTNQVYLSVDSRISEKSMETLNKFKDTYGTQIKTFSSGFDRPNPHASMAKCIEKDKVAKDNVKFYLNESTEAYNMNYDAKTNAASDDALALRCLTNINIAKYGEYFEKANSYQSTQKGKPIKTIYDFVAEENKKQSGLLSKDTDELRSEMNRAISDSPNFKELKSEFVSQIKENRKHDISKQGGNDPFSPVKVVNSLNNEALAQKISNYKVNMKEDNVPVKDQIAISIYDKNMSELATRKERVTEGRTPRSRAYVTEKKVDLNDIMYGEKLTYENGKMVKQPELRQQWADKLDELSKASNDIDIKIRFVGDEFTDAEFDPWLLKEALHARDIEGTISFEKFDKDASLINDVSKVDPNVRLHNVGVCQYKTTNRDYDGNSKAKRADEYRNKKDHEWKLDRICCNRDVNSDAIFKAPSKEWSGCEWNVNYNIPNKKTKDKALIITMCDNDFGTDPNDKSMKRSSQDIKSNSLDHAVKDFMRHNGGANIAYAHSTNLKNGTKTVESMRDIKSNDPRNIKTYTFEDSRKWEKYNFSQKNLVSCANRDWKKKTIAYAPHNEESIDKFFKDISDIKFSTHDEIIITDGKKDITYAINDDGKLEDKNEISKRLLNEMSINNEPQIDTETIKENDSEAEYDLSL